MKSHALQKKPAVAARPPATGALAPPRPFAPVRAGAAGHDFARVSVRAKNQTGLDDRLKAGIERLSGVSLDDVRVHYGSPHPARVEASAYTQGTHIHVAPGQEKHLAHEAWHVVQQKQGRVRANGRVAGLPLNDAEHLEREASVMGRRALAAGPTPAAPEPAAPTTAHQGGGAGTQSAPVQAWPEWLDRLRGKKPDPRAHYGSLSESDRYAANVQDRIAENERLHDREFNRWARSYDHAAVEETASSHPVEKAQTASTVGSGVIGKGAEGVGLAAPVTGVTTQIGAGAAGLGVASSLLSAVSGTRRLATDETQKKDKALTGLGVLSDLGSATTTAASGLNQGASAGWGFAKSAAPVLDKVAGPVAIARGGIDVVRGTAQASLAGYRRHQLSKIEGEEGDYSGVARFAKQNQTTKVVGGVGTAIGGGLALAGGLGIAGLALSGPVGWGLLAGAAGVGAGVAAYRKYRKHSIGKQLADPEYQRQLARARIHVPSDEELQPTSTWGKVKNFFTASTTSQRRYDAVRGHIAQKLAKNEDIDAQDWHPDVAKIIKHMGVKAKPEASVPSRLLDSDARARHDEARQVRAKHIAQALEG